MSRWRRWRLRAPKTQPGQFRRERGRFVEAGLFCLFGVVICRAVVLHLFPGKSDSLRTIADNQYERSIELSPYRGTIFDRKGEALAISIRKPSLAVNPRVFDPAPADVERLAHILHMPTKAVQAIADKKSYFAWLARKIDHRMAEDAMNLGLNGIVKLQEPARFYPSGSAAAQLLGFIGLDNRGMGGLERQFDKDLRGQSFKIMAAKDARGQFIFNESAVATPEKPGHSIHLTIDKVIQEIAEDELEAGVKKAEAKKGFAIVSDPHTGRILAVANYPSFDPNNTKRVKVSLTKNYAFSDVFEPGSVTKPLVVAHALELGKTWPDELHDCEGGAMRIGKATIHDSHKSGLLTTTEAIIQSSNICTYKIALKMGREETAKALKLAGLGTSLTNLDFPGQAFGWLSNWETWKQIRYANVSFGHGFMITGLELVQAMGAIANGGNLMQPTLVERILSADGVVVSNHAVETAGRLMSPNTARIMRGMLAQVVSNEHGTARSAASKFYTTAGKTGTAQKVDPGTKGYAKGKYLAGFLGFAPVQDPHLVVYVQIDEPMGKSYYGGTVAAPVFTAIVDRTLKYLNVAPDQPTANGTAPVAVGSQAHEPNAKKM